MTHRPKTRSDQQALDAARGHLASIAAGSTARPIPTRPRPVRDGELVDLDPDERRAELQRRYHARPGGDAA